MKIGEQKLRLKLGDSVFAPRKVPHVWAYIGEQPGRMLFVFTPAAKIESFFEEASKPDAKVMDPQRQGNAVANRDPLPALRIPPFCSCNLHLPQVRCKFLHIPGNPLVLSGCHHPSEIPKPLAFSDFPQAGLATNVLTEANFTGA